VRSMTGFGRGRAQLGAGWIAVELKTLNHRFLELRLHLSPELTGGEDLVEKVLRSRFSRGRVELTARLQGDPAGVSCLNRELARRCLRELEELRVELGLPTPVSIDVLAGVPDVFVASGDLAGDALEQALAAAVEQGVQSVTDMRCREGEATRTDLEERLRVIEGLLPRIEARAAEVPTIARDRLRARLARLADGELEIDEERLAQEIVVLADRSDVSEELARLRSHIDHFRAIAAEDAEVGRRLDFLLQEMAREASTTGAKAQDAQLQHLVVELRGEISRMREQVQNVE